MKDVKRISVIILISIFVFIGLVFNAQAQTSNEIESSRVTLPNGWKLSPVGKLLPLGDLPLNIAISPTKKLAAITNNGQSDQTIQLVDLVKEVIVDSIVIGKSWLGLAFTDGGKYLYASGGNDNIIIRYAIIDNKLSNYDTIRIGKPWPVKISIAGIALDDPNNRLYAVTKDDNSLYVVDTKTKKVVSLHPLGGEGYTCLLSPDHSKLYISCWGNAKVVVFDTKLEKITGSVAVGSHPNDLCITKSGQYLFVANADDNSVFVIDTRKLSVIETLNTALYPNSPAGSTTNSVALSSDEKILYIANADNNCLAVFDISSPGKSKSNGFLPTGWYPTCVRVFKDKILISSGKGLTSKANPYGPNPTNAGQEVIHHEGGKEKVIKVQYIGGLFRGSLQILKTPDSKQMAQYSQAVYDNSPYIKKMELISEGIAGNPIPQKVGDPSPIKYIFYIISVRL